VVDFDEPGLQVLVDEDVEAKDLEAVLVLYILGNTGLVYVSQ
jgi:hypothetical protein